MVQSDVATIVIYLIVPRLGMFLQSSVNSSKEPQGMHKAQKREDHIKALLPCLLVPVATITGSCRYWECSVMIFESIENSQDKKIEFGILDKKNC